MALFDEFRGSTERFSSRIRDLQDLLREHGVDGIRALVRVYRQSESFRSRWSDIWMAAARDDGGKLSLGAIGAILGASLGGVGIAALGTAFGLPLLAVLGLAGLLAGSEVDAASRRKWGPTKSVQLPTELYDRVTRKADELGLESHELIIEIVEAFLGR